MTLEEHILDLLSSERKGLTNGEVKMAMQDRAHALTSQTQMALNRLGMIGKIGYNGMGLWKLAEYCSPDLIDQQTGAA